jgi:hypothetical protein
MRRTLVGWALTFAALALPGCFIVTNDDEAVVTTASGGFVVVDWTIDGSKDPADCGLSGAAAISISLSEVSGRYVGTFEQDCDAFETSIDLYPDDYVGDAVLIDSRGYELTTPADLGPFSIFGDEALILPIDFPVDSFY